MVGQTLSPKVQLNHLEVRIGRKVARHRYLFGPPNDLFGLKTGLTKFKRGPVISKRGPNKSIGGPSMVRISPGVRISHCEVRL